MAITVAFMGVAVADFHAGCAWYDRFMGRSPDMIPNDNEAAWQLSEKGWLYLIGDAQRAGKALLTLIVDDLDGHIAELRERGIAIESMEIKPELYRKAIVTDPEGNTLTFAELISPDSQETAK